MEVVVEALCGGYAIVVAVAIVGGGVGSVLGDSAILHARFRQRRHELIQSGAVTLNASPNQHVLVYS